MYALKEHVDVEFVVKAPVIEKKGKKGRARGTAGKTNVAKAADKSAGGGAHHNSEAKASGASPRRNEKDHEYRKALEEPVSSFMSPHKGITQPENGAQESKSAHKVGSAADNKKGAYPNRPKSAAQPSKRFNAGRAFVMKQELPWNYDLSLPDRDLMTLERDAYIQSKKAAKENREKKIGVKSDGHETPGMSKVTSRTRPVKAVSGSALNGSNKTVFSLQSQKEKEALNKAVSLVSHHQKVSKASSSSPPDARRSPKPLIDKYRVSRTETGIHERPWDNSELPPEKEAKELRMLPATISKLIPMTGYDMHIDVSYKKESALRATESITSVEDGFGKMRIRGHEAVLKESSLSALPSES